MSVPAKFTALVVDDNEFNRVLFRDMLESVGYAVTEAPTGEDCLTTLATNCFDLMILDLAMPGINGTEVLKIVRAYAPPKVKQIIVATAEPHMAKGAADELADYVITKPIDTAQFQILVARLRDTFD